MTVKNSNITELSSQSDVPEHIAKCVDIDTINSFIWEEPGGLGLILKGHHAIETYLNASLIEALDESDALELSRIAFLLKADMLIALGILPKSRRTLFNRLNAYRNKFAHNPHHEIEETYSEETSRLVQSLVPSVFKKIYDQIGVTDLGPERILLFVCWASCMHTLTAACKKNIANDVTGRAIEKLEVLRFPADVEGISNHWRECESELLKRRYPTFFSEWPTHPSEDSGST